MKRHPRVLLLSPFFSPNVGGVETHLDDLVRYLIRRDAEVHMITYQPLTTRTRGASFEQGEGFQIQRLRWVGHDWFPRLERRMLAAFLYLVPGLLVAGWWRLLRDREGYDVLHAHGLAGAFVGKILGRLFGLRTVVSTHAVYDLGSRPAMAAAMKWVFKSYDQILTLSAASSRELIAIGLPAGRVRQFRYWVDQTVFAPGDRARARQELGWTDRFVVLFVGRLIAIKGMDVLLQSAETLPAGILVAFIGVGPSESHLREAAATRQNIRYLGRVNNQDLCRYYKAADLLAVPSQYSEGFGRVVLEALSCGLPVLASNLGGLPETIDSSSVGELMEPTAANFASRIRYYYEHPVDLARLAGQCRAYAVERFGEVNAEMIFQSYSGREDSLVAPVTTTTHGAA